MGIAIQRRIRQPAYARGIISINTLWICHPVAGRSRPTAHRSYLRSSLLQRRPYSADYRIGAPSISSDSIRPGPARKVHKLSDRASTDDGRVANLSPAGCSFHDR